MAQQWLSVIDAAQVLGIGPASVRHQITEGKLRWRFGAEGKQVLIGEPNPQEHCDQDDLAQTQSRGMRTAVVATLLILLAIVSINWHTASEPITAPPRVVEAVPVVGQQVYLLNRLDEVDRTAVGNEPAGDGFFE